MLYSFLCISLVATEEVNISLGQEIRAETGCIDIFWVEVTVYTKDNNTQHTGSPPGRV